MDMPVARQCTGAVLASSSCSDVPLAAMVARHQEPRRNAAAAMQLRSMPQAASRVRQQRQQIMAWASGSAAELRQKSPVLADDAKLCTDAALIDGEAPLQQDESLSSSNGAVVRRPDKAR